MRLLLAMALLLLPAGAAAREFKELRTRHFVVRYQQDERAARELLRKCDRFYVTIMRNLGVDRLDEPWSGERRCKVTAYDTMEGFSENNQGMEWADGVANYQTREIHLYVGGKNLYTRLLPHELTHLIFRDIMGHGTSIPLWLEEGVAMTQEGERYRELYPVVREAIKDGSFVPMELLMAIKSGKDLDTEGAKVFYAQAYATVRFLLHTYHQRKFLKFCRQIHDGNNAEEALRKVYSRDRVGTLKELETAVQKAVRR